VASCAKATTTPISTPASSVTTTSVTTTGNWWNKFGTPQYGGTMTLRTAYNVVNFDPINNPGFYSVDSGWMERLFTNKWTVNPTEFGYLSLYRPDQYVGGQLAESWEFTDPYTFVVHLRQNVYWQNIPPANGRQFVASDVVYSYDRLFGLGGFPNVPYNAMYSWYAQNLTSVTALDNYTVAFKSNVNNPQLITESMEGLVTDTFLIVNPEAVKQWGDLNDWHHAVGTGPFILTNVVASSSVTMVKNPNYWGTDERNPQNKLPYIDTLTILTIPDNATALASLRTGKIDALDGMSSQDAASMKQTNPSILQVSYPLSNEVTIDPRQDIKPFSDIRVREALQMAINMPEIVSTYYKGNADPTPVSLTANYMGGWGFPYSEWPQDLKDQYAYNPTQAKQLLTAAGYPNGFSTDIVVDTADDMDLLQIVQNYFQAINVTMTIKPMVNSDWVAFVQNGQKEDGLTQKPSGNLGINYEPTMEVGRFSPYPSNYLGINDPTYNNYVAEATAATSVDGFKQIFKDLNQYVAEQHYIIAVTLPNLYTLYQPWIEGYSGETYALAGNGSCLPCLNFYQARLWINQNNK